MCGGLPRPASKHPLSCSPTSTLLNRTRGENGMKKLVGQDKDREIIYHLPSRGKQTWVKLIKFIAN